MKVQIEQPIISHVKKAPKEMMSIKVEDGKTKVKINSSSLAIMQECLKKSYYTLHRGLRSNMEGPATIYGSAIHKALETFYISPMDSRAMPIKFKENSELMAHGVRITGSDADHLLYKCIQAFVDAAEPLKGLPIHDKRSIETGVWTLYHYFPFTIMSDKDGPLVERRVEFPIYQDSELEISAFGFIDAVLKNEKSGIVLITDHKTTSVLGQNFFDRLNPNFQYTFYVWGAQECLGIDSDSFLVNALQVKPKPKTARGTPPNFTRQITQRSINEDHLCGMVGHHKRIRLDYRGGYAT